jgi:hypothetical protein
MHIIYFIDSGIYVILTRLVFTGVKPGEGGRRVLDGGRTRRKEDDERQ